ncbi:hypothetical protein Fuma_02033 [Fuerstiella marisgermanici]|uniref:Uncharacterized protein n=1 Tax=Fuerstiella marisgermanici TaxID=1891926 RepID=A0A1P8WEF6_9PLAN|nr:hypothetical protein Fuma_02033 [Fuerstiella marisgermanici]
MPPPQLRLTRHRPNCVCNWNEPRHRGGRLFELSATAMPVVRWPGGCCESVGAPFNGPHVRSDTLVKYWSDARVRLLRCRGIFGDEKSGMLTIDRGFSLRSP